MGLDIVRRVNAERLVLLGWSRAILLQLAHPLIAAGVVDHSSFHGGPLTAAVRLHHTVGAMLSLTFGNDRQRDAALEGIRSIHRRVNGRLRSAAGRFPAGTYYSAEDPELVLWVHATLLESIPLAYERLITPLSETERDAYCAGTANTAVALGARAAEVPRTWAALSTYLDNMYRSGSIAIGHQAREVVAAVLAPRGARMLAPLTRVNRLMTVGWLPPDVRRQYGLSWSAGEERQLQRLLGRLRNLRSILPPRAAQWLQARWASSRMGWHDDEIV